MARIGSGEITVGGATGCQKSGALTQRPKRRTRPPGTAAAGTDQPAGRGARFWRRGSVSWTPKWDSWLRWNPAPKRRRWRRSRTWVAPTVWILTTWNWSPPALAESLPYAGCLLHVKALAQQPATTPPPSR